MRPFKPENPFRICIVQHYVQHALLFTTCSYQISFDVLDESFWHKHTRDRCEPYIRLPSKPKLMESCKTRVPFVSPYGDKQIRTKRSTNSVRVYRRLDKYFELPRQSNERKSDSNETRAYGTSRERYSNFSTTGFRREEIGQTPFRRLRDRFAGADGGRASDKAFGNPAERESNETIMIFVSSTARRGPVFE